MFKKGKAEKVVKFAVKRAVKEELKMVLNGYRSIRDHFFHRKLTPIQVLANRGKRK